MYDLISMLFGLGGTVLIFFFGVTPAIGYEGQSSLVIEENVDDKRQYLRNKKLSQLGLLFLILSYMVQLLQGMNLNINIYNSTIDTIQLIATIILGYYAYSFSRRQTIINKRMLKIHDYVEIFVMPRVIKQDILVGGGSSYNVYTIMIKNASYYPVYLQKYILNGTEKNLGNTVIPNSSDNWHQIDISNINSPLNLEIHFVDYVGRKYKTFADGTKNGENWSIKNQKKELIE